jgi:hypothetical protein
MRVFGLSNTPGRFKAVIYPSVGGAVVLEY